MYVYIIRSIHFPQQIYIGRSNDVEKRLKMHNAGQSYHTAKYKPWKIAAYILFEDKEKSVSFEKYLKSGSGRAFLHKRLL